MRLICQEARHRSTRPPWVEVVLRAAFQRSPTGSWANCSWHRATVETQLETFHQDDVWPDTVDRSYGREV